MSLLLLSLACSSPTPTTGPAASGALSGGWIEELVRSPETFARMVDGGARDGWIAMHAADWEGASASLPAGVPAARAELELALVDEDLARLAAVTWPLLLDRWRRSDPDIDHSSLPLLSALAVAHVDDAAVPVDGLDADSAAWVAALRDPGPQGGASLSKPGDGLLARCLDAHLRVRDDASAELPAPCLQGDPFVGDGGPRLYDPLLSGSLALQHRRRAAELVEGSLSTALAGAELDALLFSGWWSQADLLADLAGDADLSNPGGEGPTLAALDLPAEGPDDRPQAARERARALDAALDDRAAALRSGASPEGLALLDDLQLIGALRSRILIAWARAALLDDRPHQATAYLQLAHDLESAREVGPTNPPALFVLQAEALLRTGRTRQALDALSALGQGRPELDAIVETIGDLVVLEGMGRHGDSKEN